MQACVPSGGRRGRTQVEAGVASREEGVAASGIGTSGREQIKDERAGIQEQGVCADGEKPGKTALSRLPKSDAQFIFHKCLVA